MSYKQQSPLPIVEGGTGTQLFEMAVGKQGFGVIVCGQFSTSPLEVIQDPGTAGQVLTSNGISELPSFQSIASTGVVTELTPDTGGPILPSSGNINLIADVAAIHCGSSVEFTGSGHTVTLNVTDANTNTIIGKNSGNASMTSLSNVVLGSGNYTSVSSGDGGNIVIGQNSCQSLLTGENNIVMGFGAGLNYTGAESSNILLNSVGRTGESNILRIGNATGASAGDLSEVFICGIAGVNVGSVATVVTEASDQLGTAVLTAGSGISITPGANTITIAATGSGVTELTGDTGGAITPLAGNINLITDVAAQHAGSSVSFSGASHTLTFNVTDANDNTIIGLGCGNASISGSDNAILGFNCGSALTGGTDNVMVGSASGHNITSGGKNVLLGNGTGNAYTSSESSNILIGDSVVGTIAESNTLRIGAGTGASASELNRAFICGIDGINVGSVATVVTESGNQLGTAVITAGSGITVTPGANTITIAASGGSGLASIAGDTGGAQTGPAILLNAAATAGSSVSFSGSTNTVSLNVTDSNNNTFIGSGAGNASTTGNHNIGLGQAAATAAMSGSNNIMIGQGTGAHVTTGGSNVMIGENAGNGLTGGNNNIIVGINAGANGALSMSQNILIGGSAGASLASGGSNIYIGENAGASSSSDTANMAIGINAGTSINGGSDNVLIGNSAGTSLVSGPGNTMLGFDAGNQITTGRDNVFIGLSAGTAYTSTESSNITINDHGTGTTGESNTLRIGAGTGASAFQLNQAFISGITGITVTGAAVLVSSSNQLGVAVSSRQFKHNIEDMNDQSSAIYNLRPVTFAYNNDELERKQYGLIAEEVNEVFPDIVLRNKDNEIETVQYHLLPVLLLNEIKKLNARISALEARL